MKAEELTIGSYVKTKSGEIIKIESISTDRQHRKVGYFKNAPYIGLMYERIGNIEGVPITERILRENSIRFTFDGTLFVLYENKDKYDSVDVVIRDNNSIELNVKKNNTHIISYMPISYVHQLQQALNLCGLTELAKNLEML